MRNKTTCDNHAGWLLKRRSIVAALIHVSISSVFLIFIHNIQEHPDVGFCDVPEASAARRQHAGQVGGGRQSHLPQTTQHPVQLLYTTFLFHKSQLLGPCVLLMFIYYLIYVHIIIYIYVQLLFILIFKFNTIVHNGRTVKLLIFIIHCSHN